MVPLHILGSALVAVRSISTIVYASVRCASSEMLSRNSVTLALSTLVLIFVIVKPPWMRQNGHFLLPFLSYWTKPPNGWRLSGARMRVNCSRVLGGPLRSGPAMDHASSAGPH